MHCSLSNKQAGGAKANHTFPRHHLHALAPPLCPRMLALSSHVYCSTSNCSQLLSVSKAPEGYKRHKRLTRILEGVARHASARRETLATKTMPAILDERARLMRCPAGFKAQAGQLMNCSVEQNACFRRSTPRVSLSQPLCYSNVKLEQARNRAASTRGGRVKRIPNALELPTASRRCCVSRLDPW